MSSPNECLYVFPNRYNLFSVLQGDQPQPNEPALNEDNMYIDPAVTSVSLKLVWDRSIPEHNELKGIVLQLVNSAVVHTGVQIEALVRRLVVLANEGKLVFNSTPVVE